MGDEWLRTLEEREIALNLQAIARNKAAVAEADRDIAFAEKAGLAIRERNNQLRKLHKDLAEVKGQLAAMTHDRNLVDALERATRTALGGLAKEVAIKTGESEQDVIARANYERSRALDAKIEAWMHEGCFSEDPRNTPEFQGYVGRWYTPEYV